MGVVLRNICQGSSLFAAQIQNKIKHLPSGLELQTFQQNPPFEMCVLLLKINF